MTHRSLDENDRISAGSCPWQTGSQAQHPPDLAAPAAPGARPEEGPPRINWWAGQVTSAAEVTPAHHQGKGSEPTGQVSTRIRSRQESRRRPGRDDGPHPAPSPTRHHRGRSTRPPSTRACSPRRPNHHLLHMVRHRKDVGLDAGRKAAGQRRFLVPDEGRRTPGASNERHGPTSVRHRNSGTSWLPVVRSDSTGTEPHAVRVASARPVRTRSPPSKGQCDRNALTGPLRTGEACPACCTPPRDRAAYFDHPGHEHAVGCLP